VKADPLGRPNLACKGKPLSEDHKEKLRQSYYDNRDYTGEKNPFYGKKHTEETRRKISEKCRGKIKDNCGKKVSIKGKIYPTVAAYCRESGMLISTATHRVRSKSEWYKDWFYL
jgi:hypothetical protein